MSNDAVLSQWRERMHGVHSPLLVAVLHEREAGQVPAEARVYTLTEAGQQAVREWRQEDGH